MFLIVSTAKLFNFEYERFVHADPKLLSKFHDLYGPFTVAYLLHSIFGQVRFGVYLEVDNDLVQ